MRPNIRRSTAQVQPFTCRFDEGDYATLTYDAGYIRITARTHWNSQWAWWAAKSNQLGGKTPVFAIAKANHYNLVADERLACWATAADTDTWTEFDNVAIGASDLTFYNNAPFPHGPIYIAALPMYPLSRIQRVIKNWSSNAKIVDTASTAGFVLGKATWRNNGDGRAAGAVPYYGFKVTSTRHAYTKNKMILTARNHPSETAGSFQLEGAINWLLAGSNEAEFLLDYFDVFVYPCLNPQGVNGGYFRSQPQDATLDHNREWDNTGVLECVDAFLGAFTTDAADIEVGVDFHSWMDSWTVKGYTYDDTDALHAIYKAKMAALDADYVLVADTTASMLNNVWRSGYSGALTIGQEQGGATGRSVANWKTHGQRTLQALVPMLSEGRFTQNPGAGYRDFNGTTDRIDWASAGNLTGAAFTISAWVWPSSTPTNANQYVLCAHDSGDTSYGLIFNVVSSGYQVNCTRKGTTDYSWASANNCLTRDAWNHILLTSTGGIVTASVVFYINGSTISQTFINGSGSETAHTGSWSLGGRIYGDTRCFEGRICQLAVWDHALDATEIANLAAGYAPDLAEATGLLFYFKGNTSSLVATPPSGGSTGTADGTSSVTGVGTAPSIIYG
jgi:hypothetical protein